MPKSAKYYRAVVINNRPRPYEIRRSKRARNILLHVDVAGRIEVVLPWRASAKTAERFVKSRRAWIDKMLRKHKQHAALLPRRRFLSGEYLPCFGRTYRLRINVDPRRRRSAVRLEDGYLVVNTPRKTAARAALVRWYRTHAREYFTRYARLYAADLSTTLKAVRIADTKSQWGSCSHFRRTLSFNWRLALAPREICQYVIAHEAAHLKHPNHSRAFWKQVESLNPDYFQHRLWLRKYGYTLVF